LSTEYANAVYLKSFATIVSLYQERKDVGGLEPMLLDPNDEPQQPGLSPKPSISDFIVDVELTAKRVLDEQELRFFHHWFRSLKVLATSDPIMFTDKVVRTKLGRGFVERGIYPIQKYLTPNA
jgi:hypothetical protein